MIAAKCKKCGTIGCNNDNAICNNNPPKLKRYDDIWGVMQESKTGDWVKYSELEEYLIRISVLDRK